jgi:hypothetical protein
VKIATRAAAAVGPILAALILAGPAGADPATDPCELAVTFLCRFMPIAPALDHDIDLTQGPATINGTEVPQVPGTSAPTEAQSPTPGP